uniref:Uncharacterized protein n=1 Tax=Anguilla anguilla TaxID=7936 RepID=A0A0E9WB81_ANGAN
MLSNVYIDNMLTLGKNNYGYTFKQVQILCILANTS